jgi:hypothetical protein
MIDTRTNLEKRMDEWREILALPTELQPVTVRDYLLSRDKHPNVLPAVAELCLEAKRKGYKEWSVNGAFEILRWQSHLTTGDLGLQVNNTYRAYAARDLMLENPALWGFFEIRELKPRHDNWGHLF